MTINEPLRHYKEEHFFFFNLEVHDQKVQATG